jgi:hypothetical protein
VQKWWNSGAEAPQETPLRDANFHGTSRVTKFDLGNIGCDVKAKEADAE